MRHSLKSHDISVLKLYRFEQFKDEIACYFKLHVFVQGLTNPVEIDVRLGTDHLFTLGRCGIFYGLWGTLENSYDFLIDAITK